MNPLRAIEDALETHHHYKTADKLRSIVKTYLTRHSAEIAQKTWLNSMWKVTYSLDDLFQRENYLENAIHLLTETNHQLETIFEHLDVNNLPNPQTVTAVYSTTNSRSDIITHSTATAESDDIYASELPDWNQTAKDQIERLTQERTIIQRQIYLLEQQRNGIFSERPGGVWIREVVALMLRNQGRDFWEQGRRECIRVGGCCAKNCGCCIGWLLHCAGSCACCDRWKGRLEGSTMS